MKDNAVVSPRLPDREVGAPLDVTRCCRVQWSHRKDRGHRARLCRVATAAYRGRARAFGRWASTSIAPRLSCSMPVARIWATSARTACCAAAGRTLAANAISPGLARFDAIISGPNALTRQRERISGLCLDEEAMAAASAARAADLCSNRRATRDHPRNHAAILERSGCAPA